MLYESWFYLNPDHERMRPPPEKHCLIVIESLKFMLTIVGGFSGYHVVWLLPKGGAFHASYEVTEIVSGIASWREG
jgi:hypothetical protein